MSSTLKITAITPPMILGEGPHWSEKNHCLLFVDHPGGTVNRFYAETGQLYTLDIEGSGNGVGPSVIIPVEARQDDLFVVGVGHDLLLLEWPHEERKSKLKVFTSFDVQHTKNALNDAKCDPSGRLWAGTKGFENSSGELDMNKGSLYRIDCNAKSTSHIKEVSLSNGLSWSNDGKTFYYIDSPTCKVDAFDFDDSSGTLSNRRVVFDLVKNGFHLHYPDGMTVDMNGNLWVACYNGGKVLNIDPSTGKLLGKVEVPSVYSTSCCFGGTDYSTLYVTSATRGMTDEDLLKNPESGKTFAVSGLGVKGSPHRNFKLDAAVFQPILEVD